MSLPKTNRTDTAEYEVFKGTPEVRPFRLGYVRGCERATELMYRMYSRVPGDYFIRHSATSEIVASVQSTARQAVRAHQPVFDIFRGLPDKDAVWVETVNGLSSARDRMEQIARIQPAQYFVFSRLDHSVLALTEIASAGPPTQSNSAA